MPLDKTIDICIDQLFNSDLSPPLIHKEVVKRMLYMAVKNIGFRFNWLIYRQVDGMAMESPLGPVLENIFVGYFKCKLFKYE